MQAKWSSSKRACCVNQAEVEKREAAAKAAAAKAKPAAAAAKAKEDEAEEAIPENLNRVQLEGETASTVDEAIKVLSIGGGSAADVERHPEKRMKAAWTAFEEKRLAVLRKENPNLRLSQIRQMLHREWLKSPENPMNAGHARFNEK